MKKLVALLLTGALSVTAVASLAACGGNTDLSEIEEKIQTGQSLTTAELLEKAKEETGNFVAYGNTSRIKDAMDNFKAAYPELNLGSGSATQKMDDSDIYTKLIAESSAVNKSSNASMVLIQDSAQLDMYRNNTSILSNYIPNGMEDKVDEANRIPLAHQFINKLFIYNTAGGESNTAKFTNVWQLTDSKYEGKIYFKNPNSESVNMNFLIMLTSDEWSGKLETAYKDLNNGQAATDVGADKEYKNYGYKWIAEFLANRNKSFGGGDTDICNTLNTPENAGNLGLFVLSKFRSIDPANLNLAVSAWDKDANDKYVTIEPFAGFMYSIYAQLATNGPRPYTAMLFVNYLMTEEGFAPWAQLGGYSANITVPVTEGDSELSFWQSNLVVENGAYISSVKAEVVDYINKKV